MVNSTNKTTLTVVVGVIQNKANAYFVSLRRPNTHLAGFFEFPGGKVEPGESLFQCLVRECLEETGIHVTAATLLMDHVYDYPDRRVHLHTFLVTNYQGTPRGKEGQATQWVAKTDLPTLPFVKGSEKILAALGAQPLTIF